MKTKWQRTASLILIVAFGIFALALTGALVPLERSASAQTNPTPTPATTPAMPHSADFDQAAAIAKLREQIKGKEKEPGEKVWKNLQMPAMKGMPAGRLLNVMELGYARSLGVNCTHCHTPDRWEADDKTQKQTTRDMSAMVGKINGELLKSIKNLKSESPTVNCTTCHRGQIVPALDLAVPAKN
jgi:Photosynthetic reaction centre cytochrome C subunit